MCLLVDGLGVLLELCYSVMNTLVAVVVVVVVAVGCIVDVDIVVVTEISPHHKALAPVVYM